MFTLNKVVCYGAAAVIGSLSLKLLNNDFSPVCASPGTTFQFCENDGRSSFLLLGLQKVNSTNQLTSRHDDESSSRWRGEITKFYSHTGNGLLAGSLRPEIIVIGSVAIALRKSNPN